MILNEYAFLKGFFLSLAVTVCADIEIRRQKDMVFCSTIYTIPLPAWQVCIEVCSRISVCKSVNFIEKTKTCHTNDAAPNETIKALTGSPGDSFVIMSASTKTLSGQCNNHSCKTSELCREGSSGFTCLPLGNMDQTSGKCKTGWENFKGSCYYFGMTSLTWANAQKDCQERGSNLVKIEDQCEQEWLAEEASTQDTWIGANDGDAEGQWKWISDNSYVHDQYSYTVKTVYWYPTEPNGFSYENCAVLWHYSGGREWNDESCLSLFPYICKL